jgi:hypothetical protein
VISWSDPALPRPKPKPFITPGRQEKADEKPPELTAPPTLEASARAQAISTINVAPTPSLPRPKLAVPPSRTVPVRLPDAPPELNGSDIATGIGDPANLIILGAGSKPKDLVAVPPGSNVPQTLAEGGGTESGKSGGRTPGVTGTRSGVVSRAAASSGSPGSGVGTGGANAKGGEGSSHVMNPGVGAGRGGASTGISVSGAGTAGTPTLAAGVITLPSAGASYPAATPATTRQPKKPGVFDVVVEQTAAAGVSLADFKILKGKPVYTVYLNLGIPKAWILQYCLASSAQGNDVTGVVKLNESQPITPPYPLTTILSGVELRSKAGYTLIHGFVTPAGKFRNLTLSGNVDQQFTRLLELLEKWEFQPAMNGNSPTEVEVVLAIPPG